MSGAVPGPGGARQVPPQPPTSSNKQSSELGARPGTAPHAAARGQQREALHFFFLSSLFFFFCSQPFAVGAFQPDCAKCLCTSVSIYKLGLPSPAGTRCPPGPRGEPRAPGTRGEPERFGRAATPPQPGGCCPIPPAKAGIWGSSPPRQLPVGLSGVLRGAPWVAKGKRGAPPPKPGACTAVMREFIPHFSMLHLHRKKGVGGPVCQRARRLTGLRVRDPGAAAGRGLCRVSPPLSPLPTRDSFSPAPPSLSPKREFPGSAEKSRSTAQPLVQRAPSAETVAGTPSSPNRHFSLTLQKALPGSPLAGRGYRNRQKSVSFSRPHPAALVGISQEEAEGGRGSEKKPSAGSGGGIRRRGGVRRRGELCAREGGERENAARSREQRPLPLPRGGRRLTAPPAGAERQS